MDKNRTVTTPRRWTRWIALGLLLLPQPLFPASIPVNGTCTLVDAIAAANNDDDSGGLCPPGGSGADTLMLTGDQTLGAMVGSYSGPTGTPEITTDITIEGNGATIERAPAAPPFRLLAITGATVTLNDVTLRNGFAPGYYGGAILADSANVTLNDTHVVDNVAYLGGGLLAENTNLSLSNGSVSGNAAPYGGGIYSRSKGTLFIVNGTLENNTAVHGGAIWSRDVVTTIAGTTLAGNDATGLGGGFYSNPPNGATNTITNSTLSGNSASVGGGIFNAASALDVRHTTIYGNSATYYASAIYTFTPLDLVNTIVSGSGPATNCVGVAISDGGNNFDNDGTCPGASIVAGVDLDPALTNNGGPTDTHALLAGSVAQNAAPGCGLPDDQRGMPRNDGACDSGAFERLVNGACCTDGPVTQSDCIVADQLDCEGDGGMFLGPGTLCADVQDCTALLVTMDSMSAEATPDGVLISWTTALEIDTVGFQVLRESPTAREKSLMPIGPRIFALGDQLSGASYELLDDSAASRRATVYFVEDVDIYGKVTRHGPILVDRGERQRTRVAGR